jgi:hypothetical protein
MRILLAPLLVLCFAIPFAAQKEGQAPGVLRAPIVDSHEGVTIGVDPWTTANRYKKKFPKKSPFSGGVVALHVSFRNDTDGGMKVDLRRIRLLVQLDEDNRQELETLTAEDVADTVLLKSGTKDPTKRRIPLPIPMPQPSTPRDAKWTEFRDACQDAAVPSTIMAAHSTLEGLIYFDLRGEVDLLHTARLYVPNLATMGENQPISYFDIDLGHSSAN